MLPSVQTSKATYDCEQLLKKAQAVQGAAPEVERFILDVLHDLNCRRSVSVEVEADLLAHYQTLAKASSEILIALLFNKQYQMNMEFACQLGLKKPELLSLIEAGLPGQQVKLFRDMAKAKVDLPFIQQIMRELTLLSPQVSHASKVLIDNWKHLPQLTLSQYIGFVQMPYFLTKESEVFRTELYILSKDLKWAMFEQYGLEFAAKNLCIAWMLSSYCLHVPAKLHFKRQLNRLFDDYVKTHESHIKLSHRKKSKQAKPKLIIAAENFDSKHVMYRCYALAIQPLFDHFDIILATADARSLNDAVIKKMFKNKILALNSEHPLQIIKQLRQATPDIIYYPSLGMSIWAPITATQRIAPIQVMSFGHPDTSASNEIDYAILTKDTFDTMPDKVIADYFSEKIITLNADVQLYATLPWDEFKSRPVSADVKSDKTIRIAVNANRMKLNGAFIGVLRKIKQQVQHELQFEFFSFPFNVELAELNNVLINALGDNTVVHPPMPRQSFLNHLGQCDVAVAAFPFTSSNSLFDACLLGVPMVTLLGDLPLSRAENEVKKRVPLPDDLFANDVNEFIKKTCVLINDETVRKTLSESVLKGAPKIFSNDSEPYFAKVLLWLQKEHESIKTNVEQRVYSLTLEQLDDFKIETVRKEKNIKTVEG